MKVLGIDPGKSGALVWLSEKQMQSFKMPLTKNKFVCFKSLVKIIESINPDAIFLERAFSFGMGSKSAFNYGRGFATIENALTHCGYNNYTLIEPSKWTKLLHQGINKDLKAKEKSLIAVKRLYPKLVKHIPVNRNGKLHEGIVDALLIAGYGQRILKGG